MVKKVLYGELYENNDRMMYLMPTIPEPAYLMHWTTQIEAVTNYVDPRPDSVDLKISAKRF